MSTLEDVQKKFIDELRDVDEVAQITLKGHLIMEGLLTEAIETFLLHGEFAEKARLQISQKIALCRAISISDQNNKMWDLIGSVNTLRNALSHSLEPERRANAIKNLRAVYQKHFSDMPDSVDGIPNGIEEQIAPDSALCVYALAACHGYLHAHLAEVRRFKSIILDIDAALNKGALTRSAKMGPD